MERLKLMNFDSVIVSKIGELDYKIDKVPFGAFKNFDKQKQILED